jgi:predicted ATP-binding protein involved in virulence
MRIKEISVEGLFGVFNHTIPLNQEERITIIHSPNGYGKTAILRLIKSVFKGDLSTIGDTDFQRILIKFLDGHRYILNKRDNDLYSYFKDSKQLNSDEIQKFTQAIYNTKILFISIERVDEQQINFLIAKIEKTAKEYAELSQILESTYPTRLVEKKNAFEINTLKERLKDIEEKQAELISIGLFDAQTLTNTSFIEKVNDSNKVALSLYVEDMSKKLSVFDQLEQKVEILCDIINSRFLYKKMFVSKDKGIYFKDNNGVELRFYQLSSGEKHELVMFYELLFNVEEDTLVLIDEPEISLHVSWQTQFLNDLIRVAKVAKFDVLLATHSPQIINDRWDLTVELKGKDVSQTTKNGNQGVMV